MARVGSIISPLVSMTSELFPSMPLFIYGTVPVAASAFTAFLPETLGQPLPDTVQDLENRWAPTQRGARTDPRSRIQAGVALRLKPRPPLPSQGSLSLFSQLAESPRVPPSWPPAPGRGSWAQLSREPRGSPSSQSWLGGCIPRTQISCPPGGEGNRSDSRKSSRSRWSHSRPQHKRRMDSEQEPHGALKGMTILQVLGHLHQEGEGEMAAQGCGPGKHLPRDTLPSE